MLILEIGQVIHPSYAAESGCQTQFHHRQIPSKSFQPKNSNILLSKTTKIRRFIETVTEIIPYASKPIIYQTISLYHCGKHGIL